MNKKNIILSLAISSLIIVGVLLAGYGVYQLSYPVKYEAEIAKYSDEFGVEEELIYAIISAESGFNENAESRVGAKGLMQLMPTTAAFVAYDLLELDSFLETDLYDAETNIMLGSRYLKYLLDKFEDSDYAIIAYNAGETNLLSFIRNDEIEEGSNFTPFKETNAFLEKVKKNMRIYHKKIDN